MTHDHTGYLDENDRVVPQWQERFKEMFRGEDHHEICMMANASVTYVRYILEGKQPVRQPKSRNVLTASIKLYNQKIATTNNQQ